MKTSSSTASVLIDSNVLVIAHSEGHRFRDQAVRLLETVMDRRLGAVVAHQNLLEWYSSVTHPRKLTQPLTPGRARSILEDYAKNIDLIVPNHRTLPFCSSLAAQVRLPKGGGIYDLYLAATMLSHGIHEILTENVRDFARIPGLTATNPFVD